MKHASHLRWPVLAMGVVLSAFWVRHSRADAPQGQYMTTADTVYDTKTTLAWERAESTSTYTFGQAAAYCASLMLDGGGWRLPSMKELMTIIDDSRVEPAIDLNAFPNASAGYFWTTTIVAGSSPQQRWYLHFSNGYTDKTPESYSLSVKCVKRK
ncbi:MAG TPA: DUF1566 domain-containing protein [Polyangium sp.]|nr:DUF1566 domain-containing protein [Polyangium sp.]